MNHSSVMVGTSINIEDRQCENRRCRCKAVVILHFRLITSDAEWHVVNITDVESPRCPDHVRPF